MSLRGQNLRVLVKNGDKYEVVAEATNCTITLSNNVQDESTKDVVGSFMLPTVVSKSWNITVESLIAQDVATILTKIKNMEAFDVEWDETGPIDNQTPVKADYSRRGKAYLNDVTFNWNNRELSTKSIQFTGNGPIALVSSTADSRVITRQYLEYGQFVRLFLEESATATKVIAAARQLSLHISMTLEDASTKDTDGGWQYQEPTGLSYDISTTALVSSSETIMSEVDVTELPDIMDAYNIDNSMVFKIANVSGDNNRTASTTICSGQVTVSNLQINAPNRQLATYTAQLQGIGPYVVGQ